MAEATKTADEKPASINGQTLREQCLQLNAALKLERSGWEPDWKDLAEYIDPYSLRLQTADRNRGNRKGQKIINSVATMARRTLFQSPARMAARAFQPSRSSLRSSLRRTLPK